MGLRECGFRPRVVQNRIPRSTTNIRKSPENFEPLRRESPNAKSLCSQSPEVRQLEIGDDALPGATALE